MIDAINPICKFYYGWHTKYKKKIFTVLQVYMLYQFGLMLSTILGPSTIIIMVASAFQEILSLQKKLWLAYLYAVIPPGVYLFLSFKTKASFQLLIGKV